MPLTETLVRAPFEPPVRGFSTTRAGGVSRAPRDALNLGLSCGDDSRSVAENRARLAALLPEAPCWLQQVHGTRVIGLDSWGEGIRADAAWTNRPGRVAAVLTADCLPVLVADREGRCVAAIHAGWRGLAAGVIGRAFAALPVDPGRLIAWIGPRIGREHYEVGEQVREALAAYPDAFTADRPGHWLADLVAIATAQLHGCGAGRVIDSGRCTAADQRFFSYRRDGATGRMASVVWIDPGTCS